MHAFQSIDMPDRADALYRLRHTTAHVLAQAVLELFPEAKLAIGPPIEGGFYYDFGLPRPLTPEDLGAIEAAMRRIIAADYPLEYRVVTPDEARRIFADQPFKLELIDGLAARGETISTFRQDSFEDLCRGPHLHRTGEIPIDGFMLLNVAGAYWRGDEHNPQLQRIYGTAWESHARLEDYLERLEEAKRRDHRRLGRDLDLYSTSDEVGAGLVMWHPNGALVRLAVEDFSRKAHLEAGYEWVFSPHIGREHLWQTSGHLEFFRENMYAPLEIDGERYYLKPVNCPFHIQVFKNRLRSYRDLPKRYAEFGTVYRYERGGALHGLTRVRGFTQDDAHIFCRPDQVEDEILGALAFSLAILRAFGLSDFHAYLSTRPEKAAGAVADWDMATRSLQQALDTEGISYDVEEGGGAFYGPKIDLKVRDANGHEWQLGTIQFDFNLPERFGLEYVGEDNQPHRPYMVHRALLGSIERFFGVLIEHYAGAFPVWLAPVQAMVIPVSERQNAYAEEVVNLLKQRGLRVKADLDNERLNAKIREAQLQKIPYMLIVGARETESGTVSVRLRSGEDLGATPLEELANGMEAENRPVT